MDRRKAIIKKRDLNMWCLSIFIFFCVFKNTYIQNYIIDLTSIQNILSMGSIFLLIVLHCKNMRIRKSFFNTSLFLCTLLYVWFLLITFLNGGVNKAYIALNATCGAFLIILFVQYFSNDDRKILAILDAWKTIILILVLIDLASEIFYPQGLYESAFDSYNWFLGYKTARVLYSIPMCAMFFYTSVKRKGKITYKCWIVLLISTYTTFLSQATAASVAILLCGILAFIIDNKLLKKVAEKLLNIRIWYILYFALVFLVVISQSAGLLDFVADLFDKTSTFSGRTVIWLGCIENIVSSKGIGAGYLTAEQYTLITNWARGTNAHNQVLGLLVTGGVPAFLIYYYMIYRAGQLRSRTNDIIKMFIYGIMILGITSDTFTFSTFGFFMIWLLEYSGEKQSADQISG